VGDRPAVSYRPSGEDNLLIEYGPMELDINLRFRLHILMERLNSELLPGIIEMTPGIRTLQIHYDSLRLHQHQLITYLSRAEEELGSLDVIEVPGRIVHLPLSWDDESTRLAIQKYTPSVRPDAPWCPINIEFIRRINRLDSIEDGESYRLQCEVSGDGPRGCLSRCPGGHTTGPAPPPGYDQI
jgi:urea carboxylase